MKTRRERQRARWRLQLWVMAAVAALYAVALYGGWYWRAVIWTMAVALVVDVVTVAMMWWLRHRMLEERLGESNVLPFRRTGFFKLLWRRLRRPLTEEEKRIMDECGGG